MRVDRKIRNAFYTQKSCAKRRGIVFDLTFESWLSLWVSSGHFHERGPHRGQYVMARKGDVGPYAIDNIEIIPTERNIADSDKNMPGRRALATLQSWSDPAVHERRTTAMKIAKRAPSARLAVSSAMKAARARLRERWEQDPTSKPRYGRPPGFKRTEHTRKISEAKFNV